MADDRYDWLDEEAAERLLRGLPADARWEGAEELVALIDALRRTAPVPAKGALPGEAAALRAFRAARPTVPGRGRPGSALFARAVAACRPPVRGAGRPLRAGLAVAVAGFALGGVAVAAGAGVLPTPFGGGPTGPAVSVSPMHSPSGAAGGSEGATGRPQQTGGPDGGASGGPRGSSPGATPTPDGGGRSGHEVTRGTTAGGTHRPTAGRGPQLSEVDQEALVDTLCSAYSGGELNPDERRRLERAAGGEEGVRAFCAEHGVTSGETTTGGAGRADDGRPADQATPDGASASPAHSAGGRAGGGLPGGAGADRRQDDDGDQGDQGEDGDEPSATPSVTPSGSPSDSASPSLSPTPSASARS